MAPLSDTTIVAAIKTLIEADGTLFHASTASLLNKVYTEEPPTGRGKGRPQVNFATIAPETITLTDGDGQFVGARESTNRLYKIIFTFKQTRAENNTNLYNAVNNFRTAIRGDQKLSTTGVREARITGWDYNINTDNQSIIDFVEINLEVVTDESY